MSNTLTIVSIEGNIGSGKSTLMLQLKKYFEKNSKVIFLREPVDEWGKIKDENGITILEKFYGDQEKYSFPFQMMAYISRLKLLKDTLKEIQLDRDSLKHYIIITERSLYTDKMVFAKMLYDTGKIETVNYQIYLSWFDTFIEEFPVHKIIYVNATPETCFERIALRSRDGENQIPFEYLKSCKNYHDDMLDKFSDQCVCKEQLVLDGNYNIYENKDILDEWINSIEFFIHNR